jgi:hypothetical protein
MTENNSEKIHESKGVQKGPKQPPPHNSNSSNSDDIFSSSKHDMDYVTVEGVKLRTGYHDKKDWYLLVIKELLDNCVDFLWKYYQGEANATIDVRIERTSDSLFRIRVRNTNSKEIPVFKDQDQNDILGYIFDFKMRYGSKQNVKIISRGYLGDAMKQNLALPYVLDHATDDGRAFIDKQWEYPLIIKCNKKERHVFLEVDQSNQEIKAPIKEFDKELPSTDTEIEITLPIINEVADSLDINGNVKDFCKEYPIFTTDISFKFKLVDYTPDKQPQEPESEPEQTPEQGKTFSSLSKTEKAEILARSISSSPRKAPIKIEYPALHPISKTWVNSASIGSYKPSDFTKFIEGVYDKKGTSVNKRLRQLREGSQMKANPDNDISIAQLLADPNKAKRTEQLYYDLKKFRANLDSDRKLSLPYTTNTAKRKEALVRRIARLYDNKLGVARAVYKIEYGRYRSDILDYPYVFEIIAIPFGSDVLLEAEQKFDTVRSQFKGSVNYSISPRGNLFEGEYEWEADIKDVDFAKPTANNIEDILAVYDFRFYAHAGSKVKLPCVIFANLVSPRVDYHGHDKSRIDTEHFHKAIIAAAKSLANDIPTYRALGWTFERVKTSFGRSAWKGTYTPPKEKKQSIRETVRLMLVRERGLPDVKK